jgi:hypothetical protein
MKTVGNGMLNRRTEGRGWEERKIERMIIINVQRNKEKKEGKRKKIKLYELFLFF